jgi:hypothetical protein
MNAAHLHLILNHIPVIGILAGFIILTWGVIRRSDEVKTLGLAALVVTALVAIPVYLTGEPAEEIVENLPGVSKNLIELHEDSAKVSLIFAMIAGGLAIVSLISRRLRSTVVAKVAIVSTLAVSLAASILMARTANLGGQIRHSEIQAGAPTGGEPQNQSNSQRRERGHDDDDDED